MNNIRKKTFKDFANKDLDVFLNVDEFADLHILDGVELIASIVDNNADSLTGVTKEQIYAMQEVFKNTKTMYYKTVDLYIPRVGSVITLDGQQYYVEETSDDMGMARIVLSQNDN